MAPDKNEDGKFSELRQDLVSGEWVVIATGRARRPNDFVVKTKAPPDRKASCPFEKLEADAKLVVTQGGEILKTPEDERSHDWFVEVIPNKFPAFTPSDYCPEVQTKGPDQWMNGVGFHEVIVTRPHERSIAEMTVEEVSLIMVAYQERFQTLSDEPCVEYISILHNHGPLSGASISHPHSQLIAIPVVPPDVARSLAGSERYWKLYKRCVHCVVIAAALEEKIRIIFENDAFLVMAPFASHAAFEMRIFPKHHEALFRYLPGEHLRLFAEALHVALAKLARGLNNPSYNFFLHTAPAKAGDHYEHYHWHLAILPKTATWGGFEFGTGIEISTIAPEDAAEFLRGIAV